MPPHTEGPAPASPLYLSTLSPPALRAATESVPILGLGKPLALLIYLAASPNRSATRSQLASLLWGDQQPESSRHSVRQAIWYLRRRANRDLVIADGESLTLAPEIVVDRDEFLARAERGDYEAALQLYTEPYVSAFATPGGAGFEDWCALERRRLAEVYRHACEHVVREKLSAGRAREAVELARTLRDQDVYDERGWRLLLEVALSARDMLLARTEAEALATLAQQEEMELEPATRAAMRQSRGLASKDEPDDGSDAAKGHGFAESMVARAEPFAALLAAWERARRGRTTRVHITARPGIGKTRLLEELAARLRGMRGKVVFVHARLGTRDLAYAVASEVAAGLAALPGKKGLSPASAATLVSLNPTLSSYFDSVPRIGSEYDAVRPRSLAIRELAAAVSFEQPVALIVDDLHWCDATSLAICASVADALPDAKLLIVTSGRPEARHLGLVDGEATQHLELDALTIPQVEELVQSIAALPAEAWASDFAAQLWRATRGTPLLVLEQLQLLEDRQLLRRENGIWRTEHVSSLGAELAAGDAMRARVHAMERGDRWLLSLLSAAGTSLDAETIVAASDRSAEEVRQRLSTLEGSGQVVRDSEGWRVAHDEIAEVVREIVGEEAIARAGARVGRALGSTEPWSERRGRRAAALLRGSEDASARHDLFRRFARARYADGDRRPVLSLAIDLFGDQASDQSVRDVVRSAPLAWRLGLTSTARRVVAALVVGTTLGLAISLSGLLRRELPPDAVLGLALMDDAGHVTFRSIELHEDRWAPSEMLATASWNVVRPFGTDGPASFSATWDPERQELVTDEVTNDDGVIDIFEHRNDGTSRRLTKEKGDDQAPALSPDGASIAFHTARWDSLSHYDIALYSRRDGTITQLTSGPATDLSPRWSPDGRLLAFTRDNWGGVTDELCVITVATKDVSCRSRGSFAPLSPLGWIDNDRLITMASVEGVGSLGVLQWSTGEYHVISDRVVGELFSISPDGHWAYCICQSERTDVARATVFPTAAPQLARIVALSDSDAVRVTPFWIRSSHASRTARITIDATRPTILYAGIPLQLRARAHDERGRDVTPLTSVRWRTSDSAAARIDSLSGIVIANAGATAVRVQVLVGKVTVDSLTIPVAQTTSRRIVDESWSDTTLRGWLPFGQPEPRVVADGERGFALLMNGDGSFGSGLASDTTVDVKHGVALEIVVSAVITRDQWQRVSIDLLDMPADPFRRMRGKNSSPLRGGSIFACSAGYPVERAVGSSAPVFAFSRTGRPGTNFPVPSRDWLTGGTHRILLQLFPDGRCGLALDDQAMFVIPAGSWQPPRVRAVVNGSSVGTTVLVRRLRLVEGVLEGVDWTRATTAVPAGGSR